MKSGTLRRHATHRHKPFCVLPNNCRSKNVLNGSSALYGRSPYCFRNPQVNIMGPSTFLRVPRELQHHLLTARLITNSQRRLSSTHHPNLGRYLDVLSAVGGVDKLQHDGLQFAVLLREVALYLAGFIAREDLPILVRYSRRHRRSM